MLVNHSCGDALNISRFGRSGNKRTVNKRTFHFKMTSVCSVCNSLEQRLSAYHVKPAKHKTAHNKDLRLYLYKKECYCSRIFFLM